MDMAVVLSHSGLCCLLLCQFRCPSSVCCFLGVFGLSCTAFSGGGNCCGCTCCMPRKVCVPDKVLPQGAGCVPDQMLLDTTHVATHRTYIITYRTLVPHRASLSVAVKLRTLAVAPLAGLSASTASPSPQLLCVTHRTGIDSCGTQWCATKVIVSCIRYVHRHTSACCCMHHTHMLLHAPRLPASACITMCVCMPNGLLYYLKSLD